MAIVKLQTDIEKCKGIRYEFDSADSPIGEGGMGKVYKGVCINERNGTTRPVAIKFMFDDLPESAYERARREAGIQLRNDNLVEMLGFLETQEQTGDGRLRKHYHVISELLTGVSLYDVLEGKTKGIDGEDVSFAVKMLQDYKNDPEHFAQIIVVNVLSGLMALHDAGYIHRDIDPSNIMLTSDGHIKLIDFGIAKQMNNLTTGDKGMTVAGKFMGKPEYAAPELVLGDIKHQNQTTDIYAVGILLYQCILGHTPFEGARHEILDMQLKKKMPLSMIKNKALREVIKIACEKKQELRYQTSSQMRVALENISGSKPAMPVKKKYTLIGLTIIFIIVLISVTFVVKNKQEETRKQAEMALVQKQKAEILATIKSKTQEADRIMKVGLSRENEDTYEQQIMNAINMYIEIGKIISENPNCEIPLTSIEKKKKDGINAIDSAYTELSNKASALKEMGELDIAKGYDARINVLKTFKETMK